VREVYLLRHGQAESTSPTGDSGRRLTSFGREQAAAVGRGLAGLGVQVDVIWHSPFVRAVETAELVSDALGCRNLVEQPGVVPGGDPGAEAEHVLHDGTRRLLIVSHLPFLPGLVSALLRAPVRVDIGTADLLSLALLGEGPAYLRAHVPSRWTLASGDGREEKS
jgi:phosphohistidine phosphatase